MIKLYTQKSPEREQPKQQTIQFILNYSKQFRVAIAKENIIEFNLN